MRVLLSIKPEFAERILSGEKKFEFRKSIFKNNSVDTVVIYATMPVGKVIGEFKIGTILSSSPSEIWDKTKKHAGISHGFFKEYFEKKERAFAISVKSPVRYEQPIDLRDMVPNGVPPQSYRYL